MNTNSKEKTADQKRIKEEFIKLYNDFPFKYSFWEEKAGIPTSAFTKKMSDKGCYKHYHFLQEELDNAKAYIKEKAPQYF